MQDTITAIARLIIPVIAGVLTAAGIQIDANTVAIIVCGVITVATFVWAWWKNNNITDAAKQAQGMLDALKSDTEIQVICDRSDDDTKGE